MAFLKSSIGLFTALPLALLGSLPAPALADKNYKLEIDRFDGTKMARYTPCGRTCNTTKGSTVSFCFFVNSTESSEAFFVSRYGHYIRKLEIVRS